MMMGWHAKKGQNAVFPVPESQRPIIPVKMCGECGCQTIQMMVDSGNDISLLNRQDAARICLRHGERMIKVAGISQNAMGFTMFGHVPIQIGMTDPVSIPVAVGDVRDNLLGREQIRHDFDFILTRDNVILRRHPDVPIANVHTYDQESHVHGGYQGGYV